MEPKMLRIHPYTPGTFFSQILRTNFPQKGRKVDKRRFLRFSTSAGESRSYVEICEHFIEQKLFISARCTMYQICIKIGWKFNKWREAVQKSATFYFFTGTFYAQNQKLTAT